MRVAALAGGAPAHIERAEADKLHALVLLQRRRDGAEDAVEGGLRLSDGAVGAIANEGDQMFLVGSA